MNCINHPEAPVSAYCQNCGKPLCTQCVRPVQGVIFCESCLAARLSGASGYSGLPGSGFQSPPGGPNAPDQGPNPGLAAFLGFVPGVGAMYNGQFIKALIHVLVFVVLVSLTDRNGVFGIFVGAWVLYQVFDAYQTARARRDMLPLPDPFGLNELGNRMTGHPQGMPPSPISSSAMPAGAVPPVAQGFVDPQGFAGPMPGQPVTYASEGSAAPFAEYPYSPVPPQPPPSGGSSPLPPFPVPRRSEPVGAIILIGLGLLFLFSTTGFLSGEWVSHGWPLILIAIGGWLVVKRVSEGTRGGR